MPNEIIGSRFSWGHDAQGDDIDSYCGKEFEGYLSGRKEAGKEPEDFKPYSNALTLVKLLPTEQKAKLYELLKDASAASGDLLKATRQQAGAREMEVQTMEEHKLFYTTADIVSDLSISEREAVELVKKLHKELKASGCLVVSGKIPAAWYEQQKESGFMKIGHKMERIPLTERRLLNIREFREYAGGIGDGMARKLAKEIRAVVHVGDRLLVDRIRFDEWCSEQNQQGQQ